MLSLADFEVVRDDAHLVVRLGFRAWSELLEPLRRPRAPSRSRFARLRHRGTTRPRADRGGAPGPAHRERRHPVPQRGRPHRPLVDEPARPARGLGVPVRRGELDRRHRGRHRAVIAENPELPLRFFRQPGKGKGDAVRFGFAQAKGDVLLILDSDMGVAPRDVPKFVEALARGKCEMVNGSRLVYPMEGKAMRFLNLLANKFFAMPLLVAARPAGARHAVRDEGAVARGLRAHRGEPLVLRRLRPLRGLRPALRRRAAQPPHRRSGGALPRAPATARPNISRFTPRVAAAADERVRRAQAQVPVRAGLAGVSLASLERLRSTGDLWRRKPELARGLRAVVRPLLGATPRGARVLEVESGPGLLAESAARHPTRPSLVRVRPPPRPLERSLVTDAGQAAPRHRQRGGRGGPRRPPPPARPAASSARPRGSWAAGGRLALVEPWITPSPG